MAKNFRKWNDLNQFHEVRKGFNYPRIWQCLKDNGNKIKFGLKIKLHGTNAAVRIEPDGKVVAQKRSSDVSEGHFGFAAWVADNEAYFSRMAISDATMYVYGEWAGPGVQTGVACSMTDDKNFYVFNIDVIQTAGKTVRLYEPQAIEDTLLGGMLEPDNLFVLPWHDFIEIDFEAPLETEKALVRLNRMVEEIGVCDPFIKEVFEIEGAGEGLVAYPLMGKNVGIYEAEELEYFSWFNFKAKSEHHRVNKTKHAVAFDPEKFAGVQAFADAYVTEQRCLQAFTEAVNREKDMRLTPTFIKWVVSDIHKESSTEREANPELDWKVLSKTCATRAVLWYKAKCMEA